MSRRLVVEVRVAFVGWERLAMQTTASETNAAPFLHRVR